MPPHYVLLSMAFFLGVSGRGFLQSRRARLAMDPSDTACPALSAMPDFDLNKVPDGIYTPFPLPP